MRSRVVLALLTVLLSGLPSIPRCAAQSQVQPLSIAILKIQGHIAYERDGWRSPQPLLPGALITPTDLIYPDHAALLVLCPDNSTREFVEGELIPNAVVRCPSPPSA